MADEKLPTPAEIRNLLAYDAETDALTWRVRPVETFNGPRSLSRMRRWNTRYAGKEAFTALTSGYRSGRFGGKTLLGHRVAWALFYGAWPRGHIDHINGDRADNRISNLRDVDHETNLRNMKRSKKNTTGHVGVYRVGSKWTAQISVHHKSRHLGTFDKFEDAVLARLAAERSEGFHPSHGKK
jgi:hypothetical protein